MANPAVVPSAADPPAVAALVTAARLKSTINMVLKTMLNNERLIFIVSFSR